MIGWTRFTRAVCKRMLAGARGCEGMASSVATHLIGPAILGCALAASPAVAQQGVVSGTVVSEAQQPLAGVQVVVEGTMRGVLTDAAGRFRIGGLSGSEVTLRAIVIGYRSVTQTVPVGTLDVRFALAQSAIELDQLVVTGTPGATQRRSLGNALAQISASQIVERAPVTDVSQLLNARAPGVILQTQQGTAGGGARILIRGRGSMQFAGDPLIYVDGVRVNNDLNTGPSTPEAGAPIVLSRLDDVNPNDIESIEIIKGPAAATLYGTEASGGVIQIITKRGRSGAARINLQVRQGVNWLRDQEGVVGTVWGRDQATNQVFEYDPLEVLRARGAEYFRSGHTQGYDLSISGGADDIQYYVSGGWDRDEGIVPTNASRKFRGRANVTFQPRPTVDVRADLAIATGRTDTYHFLYFFSGRYALPATRNTLSAGFNGGLPPDVQNETQEIYQELSHFTGSVQVNHRPVHWLDQRLALGLDLTDEQNVWLIPFVAERYKDFYTATARLGQKSINELRTGYTTLDYGGTVTLPVSGQVESKSSVGLQYYRRLTRSGGIFGEQFPAPGVTSIDGITGPRRSSEDFVESTTVGVYAQQQISWRDRLFFTAALRADDNSAFGANFDLVTYPKVSASWVISEEPFWRFPYIADLKLRAAYGESGQQPSAFAAIRTYQSIAGRGDRPAGTPQFVGNPDLGPERGRELEVGFDAGLLDGRVGVDLTYYLRRTEDAIVSREVAPSTGFPATQFVNAGEVKNSGIEVGLTARMLDTRLADLDLNFNYSHNANEVVSLNVPGVPFIGVGFIPNRHQPGYPVASYFGKRVVSALIGADGRATEVLCDDGEGGSVPCTQAPAVFLGQNVPKTEGSFAPTLTLFDRLRVYGLVDFKLGRSYFSADRAIRCQVLRTHEINFFPERFDPRDVAACQLAGGLGTFDSQAILKADFAKLREVSLNYTLPDRLATVFNASGASITLGARNLHTWRRKGPFQTTDPEVFTAVNYASSNHDQGIVPLPTQIIMAFNVTF